MNRLKRILIIVAVLFILPVTVYADPVLYAYNEYETTELSDKATYGDIITYKISYENPYAEYKTVEIFDKIPDNTTLVQVMQDGIYTDGYAYWNLNVPPESHGMVKFQVRADGNLVENVATVRINGKDIYTNPISLKIHSLEELGRVSSAEVAVLHRLYLRKPKKNRKMMKMMIRRQYTTTRSLFPYLRLP